MKSEAPATPMTQMTFFMIFSPSVGFFARRANLAAAAPTCDGRPCLLRGSGRCRDSSADLVAASSSTESRRKKTGGLRKESSCRDDPTRRLAATKLSEDVYQR